jgi:TRAP-type C4-dicarboxylate transport system permease small subunit
MESTRYPVPSGDKTTVIFSISIMVGLALILVALRFYTRYSFQSGLKWDDFLIAFALAASTVVGIVMIFCSYPSPGYHV